MAHGRADEAGQCFAEALRLKPDLRSAQDNALRVLQARHPLFAFAWTTGAAFQRVPARQRPMVAYACLMGAWLIGAIVGMIIGGDTGFWIGYAVTLLLLSALAFLFLSQPLFIWLSRRGILS
jgi:hypothetical protein